MSGRFDKIQAGMNSHVHNALSAWLLLLTHVLFMLIVNEVNNWYPRMSVVDIVSKSRCVNDGELDLEHFLFKLFIDS